MLTMLSVLVVAACCCQSQCLPGSRNDVHCVTCDSVEIRCDTVIVLDDGSLLTRTQENWSHVRGTTTQLLLKAPATKDITASVFSHYLHLRVGRSSAWYDVSKNYAIAPFAHVRPNEYATALYGRIDSRWSLVHPNGEVRVVDCDSIIDATWNCAVIVKSDKRIAVRLSDTAVIVPEYENMQFVGENTVLYRTITDAQRKEWRLQMVANGFVRILRYDTVVVFGTHLVGRMPDHDVVFDSVGQKLFATKYYEKVEDCSQNRVVISQKNRSNWYLSDLHGVRLNAVDVDRIYVGKYGFHIASLTNDRSLCVLNDNGDVVVPHGLYYPALYHPNKHNTWRIIEGVAANGIVMMDDKNGQRVFLQVTPTGYRELRCSER